ncbi:MAG: AAA family ATPase [Thermoanaerobaculia bacterium]|nr:AAA family ATPase [Thermoanaerobaculia bacterium]
MNRTSPFKFLDSYQKDDFDVFFGRRQQTEALYDALSGVKLLLMYGPSGAGKTSLVECGLRNQISDADWLAVTIRRNNDMNVSVFSRIRELLSQPFDVNPATQLPEDAGFGFGDAAAMLFSEQYKPVYLLFDQFEELLIQGDDAEKQAFFLRLNQLIRFRTPCRVMLIMREEFIGYLSEFESFCPNLFQHRFRLEKMNRSDVREVIVSIFNAPRYQSHFTVSEPEQLANKILTRLPDDRKEIELTHVQVFLSELWDRAARNAADLDRPAIQPDLVRSDDNLEGVLDSFLKKQLAELTPEFGGKAPIELLSAMISERHTKLQPDGRELENHFSKNRIALSRPLPELLHQLERRRILRSLSIGDQIRYEISHDVLARVVGQSLPEEIKLREKAEAIYRVYEGRQGYFTRDDLDYLRPFESYLPLGEQELLRKRMVQSEKWIELNEQTELIKARRRLRQTRFLLVAAMLAVILAVYFGKTAMGEKNKAIRLAEIASNERNKAQNERNKAQMALEQAKIEQKRADEAEKQKEIEKINNELNEILSKIDGMPSAEKEIKLRKLYNLLEEDKFRNNQKEILKQIRKLKNGYK